MLFASIHLFFPPSPAMAGPRPPQASITTILFARPVRVILAAVVFCIIIASLQWSPPKDVSVRLSHYFDQDKSSSLAPFPPYPSSKTLADEFADKYDTNEQASASNPSAVQKPGRLDDSQQMGGHRKDIPRPDDDDDLDIDEPQSLEKEKDNDTSSSKASKPLSGHEAVKVLKASSSKASTSKPSVMPEAALLSHESSSKSSIGETEALMGHEAVKSIAETAKVASVSADGAQFAYVFYATQDVYACSVLVNVDRMQNQLKVKYPIYVLVTNELSEIYLEGFKQRNVIISVQEVPPLADGGAGYYRDCLVKLLAFQMHHVNPSLKRIIMMDSDQLVLKNLDHLFEGLPQVDLAAPRAYWLSKATISSTFMVINLSDRLWNSLEPQIKNISSDKYDMDLVNDIFSETVLMLPGNYITINSHWETWSIPKWYQPQDQAAVGTSPSGKDTVSSSASSSASLQSAAQERVAVLPPKPKEIVVTSSDETTPNSKLVKRAAGSEDEGEDDVGFSDLQGSQAGRPGGVASWKSSPRAKPKAPKKGAKSVTPGQSAKGSKSRPTSSDGHDDMEVPEPDADQFPPKPVKADVNFDNARKGTHANGKSPKSGASAASKQAAKPVIPEEASKGASKVSSTAEDDLDDDDEQSTAKAGDSVATSKSSQDKAGEGKQTTGSESQPDHKAVKPVTPPGSDQVAKPVIPAEALKGTKVAGESADGLEDEDEDDLEFSKHSASATPAQAAQDAEETKSSSDSASDDDSTKSASPEEQKSETEKASQDKDDSAEQEQPGKEPIKKFIPKPQRPSFQELYNVYDSAYVLHFFALGKPWTWSYETTQSNREDAHPLFYEQFKEWRSAALRVCPPGVIDQV